MGPNFEGVMAMKPEVSERLEQAIRTYIPASHSLMGAIYDFDFQMEDWEDDPLISDVMTAWMILGKHPRLEAYRKMMRKDAVFLNLFTPRAMLADIGGVGRKLVDAVRDLRPDLLSNPYSFSSIAEAQRAWRKVIEDPPATREGLAEVFLVMLAFAGAPQPSYIEGIVFEHPDWWRTLDPSKI